MAETNTVDLIEMIGYKVLHQSIWKCIIDNCTRTEPLDEPTIMPHMLFDHGLPPEKVVLDMKDGSVWIQGGLEKINEGQIIN